MNKYKKAKKDPWLEKRNLELPFDLYSRNYYISKFIQLYKNSSGIKKLRVLDVGGRSGRLSSFIDTSVELSILDIRESALEERNYVRGDITNPPFVANSFDIVTASELLEHMSVRDRYKALKQMLRLTKDIVIISSPFYSRENVDAEKLVNSFFKKMSGNDHLWLKEHLDFSLPKKKQLEDFLVKNNCRFFTIESNNISMWVIMQFFLFSNENFGIKVKEFNRVNRFYNENFSSLGDSINPTYRKIYFISKNTNLMPQLSLKSESVFDSVKIINLLVMIIKSVPSTQTRFILNERSAEFRNLVKEKDRELASIYDSRAWRLVSFLRKIKFTLPLLKDL